MKIKSVSRRAAEKTRWALIANQPFSDPWFFKQLCLFLDFLYASATLRKRRFSSSR